MRKRRRCRRGGLGCPGASGSPRIHDRRLAEGGGRGESILGRRAASRALPGPKGLRGLPLAGCVGLSTSGVRPQCPGHLLIGQAERGPPLIGYGGAAVGWLVAVEGIGLAVARWAELRGGASRAASVAPGGFTDADTCLAARPAGPPSRAPAGLGEVGFFSGCGCRIEEQGALVTNSHPYTDQDLPCRLVDKPRGFVYS